VGKTEQETAGIQKSEMTLEQVISLLGGQLGDVNIQLRGLKTAKIKNGEPIGRTDAVVAFAEASGAGVIVSISHALGRVPGYIRLITIIPPAGAAPVPHVSVSPVEYEKWTETTARVDLALINAGSLDGCIVVLEVAGERAS
jgi:hypothetical protein